MKVRLQPQMFYDKQIASSREQKSKRRNNLDILELRKCLPTTISFITFQHHTPICIPTNKDSTKTTRHDTDATKYTSCKLAQSSPAFKKTEKKPSRLYIWTWSIYTYQITPARPFQEENAHALSDWCDSDWKAPFSANCCDVHHHLLKASQETQPN